ncbi:MAG: GNAT family N-acetyltransferase [Candidatus ainarchaeum sp.]|nr:GNAT family N-acetyltransferase [Candidatus ainarchaeum sp.]
MKIRLIKKNELKKVAKIYSKVYLKLNENWPIKNSEEFMNYWYKKQKDLFYVALINNEIVGAGVFGIKPLFDGNRIFDGEVFVHENFQKNGIGTEIVKIIFNKAKKEYHVNEVELFTFKNGHQLKWWKKLGLECSTDFVMISGKIN